MKLFYKHNWIPSNVAISLLLVNVQYPDKIKDLDDLLPYVKIDLVRLIESERHPERIIQDLMPEIEMYISPGDVPEEIANLLLSSDLFSSNLAAIREMVHSPDRDNLRDHIPSAMELKDLYRERSLYSFIEDMFGIYN